MTRWLLTITLGLALLTHNAVGQELKQQRVRLATGEWLPYTSQHLPHHGLLNQIVTESFALEHIKIDYGFFPWARGFAQVKAGDWDGLTPAFLTEPRTKRYYYSKPIFSIKRVFFHHTRYNFNWDSLADLQEIKIGTNFGYGYSTVFTDAIAKYKLQMQEAPNELVNFKKLLGRRIDVFPNTLIVGSATIHTNFSTEQAKKFTYHPKPLHVAKLYLVLGKSDAKNAILIKTFNRGLAQLKSSGRLQKLIEQSYQGLKSTRSVSSKK
ncbi:MAG: transporter substrate-binding domain-containing protein [Psychrosphaera sp.]|nr:transporter substrate-binding domain-containing protein [Psychrosphaera sp.]